MNDPHTYSGVNFVTRLDAKYIMDKYFKNIKWLSNGGDLVLDIGCGDGAVTYEFLLNMPNTIGMLVGTDISENMLKYATTLYQHPKLQFQQLDIGTNKLPTHFIGKFDHVLSNYCLHWIQNQRQAYTNIYNALKPDGNLLVAYLAEYPLFAMYETISKMDKWKSYMMDYKNYVSPYHNNLNGDKKHKQLLENIGYDVIFCKFEQRTFVYKNLIFWRGILQSVNPFVERIPESKRDEYIDEYMFETEKRGLIKNNKEVHIPYDLLVVYAQKRS